MLAKEANIKNPIISEAKLTWRRSKILPQNDLEKNGRMAYNVM